MKYLYLISVCAFSVGYCIEHDFKGFDDTILFGINWPGSPEVLENLVEGEGNKPQVTSIILFNALLLFICVLFCIFNMWSKSNLESQLLNNKPKMKIIVAEHGVPIDFTIIYLCNLTHNYIYLSSPIHDKLFSCRTKKY